LKLFVPRHFAKLCKFCNRAYACAALKGAGSSDGANCCAVCALASEGCDRQEHRDEASTPIRHSIVPRERLRAGVNLDHSDRKIVRIPASPSSTFRFSWQVQQLHKPRWTGSNRTQLSVCGSEVMRDFLVLKFQVFGLLTFETWMVYGA
jgi:hypothetical protein